MRRCCADFAPAGEVVGDERAVGAINDLGQPLAQETKGALGRDDVDGQVQAIERQYIGLERWFVHTEPPPCDGTVWGPVVSSNEADGLAEVRHLTETTAARIPGRLAIIKG